MSGGRADGCAAKAGVDHLGLTDVPRENPGGIFRARLKAREDRKFKGDGQSNLRRPLNCIRDPNDRAVMSRSGIISRYQAIRVFLRQKP